MISEIRSASTMMPLQATAPVAQAKVAAPAQEATATHQTDDAVDIRPQTKLEKQIAAVSGRAAEIEKNLEPHEPGEIILKTKGSLFQGTDRLANKFGMQLMEKFDFPKDVYKSMGGDVLHFKLPEGMSTAQAMALLEDDPSIEFAIPNRTYQLEDDIQGPTVDADAAKSGKLPNDLKDDLWGLHNHGQNGGTVDADIDAPEAWQKTTGLANGSGPIIAVIDTGVDYNHPDLVNNIWTNTGEIPGNGIDDDGDGVIDNVHGYNAFDNSGDPMDAHSHGTHCAGTIAAEGNNGLGVVGVNWKATIMPIKIFNDQGSTNTAAIIRGINFASSHGARITSNSWGGGPSDKGIQEAFRASSALHIMAAGNNGTNNDLSPHYPSSYRLPNSIAVAATDRNDQIAWFSCYGKESVDIAAPGVDILSTVPGGGYGVKSGTSMATPHVTGAAGLLLAMDPNMSNDELKERLLQGADKIDGLQDKVATGARLNVNNSMEMQYNIKE